jgi:hypothetical protein
MGILQFPAAGALAQDIREIQSQFRHADQHRDPGPGQDDEIAFVPGFGSNCFLLGSERPSGTEDFLRKA